MSNKIYHCFLTRKLRVRCHAHKYAIATDAITEIHDKSAVLQVSIKYTHPMHGIGKHGINGI